MPHRRIKIVENPDHYTIFNLTYWYKKMCTEAKFANSLSCHYDKLCLDRGCIATVRNCWQQGDYTAIGNSVTVLPAVFNSY